MSYGAEGLTRPSHTLWVVNNTFVNRRSSGTFVATAEGSDVRLRNKRAQFRGSFALPPWAIVTLSLSA